MASPVNSAQAASWLVSGRDDPSNGASLVSVALDFGSMLSFRATALLGLTNQMNLAVIDLNACQSDCDSLVDKSMLTQFERVRRDDDSL